MASKHTFIKFVGGCFLNGKAVAAYRVDSDTIQLRAETADGTVTSPVRNISNAYFEALKAKWYEGVISHQDAIVVYRGLKYLGAV